MFGLIDAPDCQECGNTIVGKVYEAGSLYVCHACYEDYRADMFGYWGGDAE